MNKAKHPGSSFRGSTFALCALLSVLSLEALACRPGSSRRGSEPPPPPPGPDLPPPGESAKPGQEPRTGPVRMEPKPKASGSEDADAVKPPPEQDGPEAVEPGTGPQTAQPAAQSAKRIEYRPLPVALTSARIFSPAAPAAGILPSDFVIGTLASDSTPSIEAQSALSAARGFLSALCSGSFAGELALPSTKPLLALEVSPLLKAEKRPGSFRIGSLLLNSDSDTNETVASARIRLENTIGEINLRQEEKTWYVESISFDAADSIETAVDRDSAGLYEPRLGGN